VFGDALTPKNICAAFLLSGDTAIAEEAVHEAILSLDMEDLSTDALSICAATLSIQRSSGLVAAGNPAPMKLPDELLHVLKLPRLRRQCFVLRFLLGLPESICASLLRTDQDEICDATCAALSELAAAGGERIERSDDLARSPKGLRGDTIKHRVVAHHPIG